MLLHRQAIIALALISAVAFTSAQSTKRTTSSNASRPATTTKRPATTTKRPATTTKKPASTSRKPSSRTLRGSSTAPAKPATTTASSTCKSKVVRRELRDLTASDRSRYIQGMRRAVAGNPSMLNKLSATHLKHNNMIHAGPNFLPWHRLFIRRLEAEIQKGDASFALHYWDWTKDARQPERSAILSNSWFGGNSNGRCLKTTNFGQVYAGVPTRHCLTRQYVQGSSPGPMYPRAITDAIRDQYDDYVSFAQSLEGGPHAAPHNGCGGDMGSMQSSEDPMFFAHHSFIDYLFAQWQDIDRTNRMRDYGGVNQDGSNARLSDALVSLNGRVSDVLDYRKLCYSYAATGGPDNYGTINDMDWEGAQRGNTRNNQQQVQQQSSDGWAWDDRSQQWMWVGLVRRDYSATRAPPAPKPTYAAPAAAAAPRTNYTAPAASNYGTVKSKVAPLRMPTEEELDCIAKQYSEPLVHPRPIDEEWLKMNGLCVETQRALEQSYCDYINKVNDRIQENCAAY